ncbi:MAG TPA: phospholipid carrier-dependent glycosyltransferase [Pirellulales bacterium]|nr:phospholipid carrier-dependent glycosyltransferase [Pirellulales bacterium]
MSEGTLFGDEAAFACTTDRMRATGDWIVPYITDEPHLNATPLYNWLTLAIAPWFDEAPIWYRFWSAAFGVGCVLITYALGTLLFRAEVGLLAGLFLCFNRSFLFAHGIRFGGMDAMLTFFISTAIFCYAWLQRNPARSWPVWASLGLCIGLAWLSKPPVFGCFFILFISLHHLWIRRCEPLASRVVGPSLAFVVGFIIAAPWYLTLWLRLGNPSLYALFVHNSVDRALDPSIRDYLVCYRSVWRASAAFKLMAPALVCAVGCWLANHRRRQWGLLLILAGSYLFTLTVIGKCFQYIFYVFPLLSVILAGLFLDSAPYLWRRCGSGRWARAATHIGVGLVAALVVADCVRTIRILRHPAWVHPPVGIYERLAPELELGHCHLALLGFPVSGETSSTGRGVPNFEDLYYCPRMPLAIQVKDVGELENLLKDRKPAIVMLSPTTSPTVIAALRPELQVENNPWPAHTYPVLLFNGMAGRFTGAELVRLSRGSQR